MSACPSCGHDNIAGADECSHCQQTLVFLTKPHAKSVLERIHAVIYRPRPFVRTADYFGPDRRRKQDPSFNGPWRRATDPGVAPSETGQIAARAR